MRMKFHGKLLFIGAATVSILIAKGMFVPALITGLVCVLIAESIELTRKREEKNKLTCNDCFHFMQSDLYTKPQYFGFCCHKQTTLDSNKICKGFQAKE